MDANRPPRRPPRRSKGPTRHVQRRESASSGIREEIRQLLLARSGSTAPVRCSDIQPQLAKQADRAFTEDGWLFEIKYDGFRTLAGMEDGKPRLLLRSGNDATAAYPEVTEALAALNVPQLVLDGEL